MEFILLDGRRFVFLQFGDRFELACRIEQLPGIEPATLCEYPQPLRASHLSLSDNWRHQLGDPCPNLALGHYSRGLFVNGFRLGPLRFVGFTVGVGATEAFDDGETICFFFWRELHR